MKPETTKLLSFLENRLSAEAYLEAETLIRAIDEDAGPMQGAMDQRRSFAMDSRHPGRIVADRECALQECEAVVPRSILIACDSAESVFRTALKHMGVQAGSLHASALPVMFRTARRSQHGGSPAARVAMDGAASKSFFDRFPEAARIKAMP